MYPQPLHFGLIFDHLRCCHRHTLEHFGDITQVESVVRLVRGWQQFSRDGIEDIERRLHERWRQAPCPGAPPGLGADEVQQGHEDLLHGVIIKLRDGDEVEVAHEPGRQIVAPATRGRDRAVEHDVLNLLEIDVILLTLVPTMVVQPLAQDLNRGLRAVLLDLRHICVVHKHQPVLADRRAENPLTPLLKAAINDVLRLVRAGLRRELQEHRHKLLLVDAIQKHLLH
mmetsp:Transcript_89802/g.155553  ORF Transcript_89802/g.155553 Transcript_89802/m.155553 type:complete len:227 (-) Transcript_89802:6634-7314(-)